jgi:hypothetical protein
VKVQPFPDDPSFGNWLCVINSPNYLHTPLEDLAIQADTRVVLMQFRFIACTSIWFPNTVPCHHQKIVLKEVNVMSSDHGSFIGKDRSCDV